MTGILYLPGAGFPFGFSASMMILSNNSRINAFLLASSAPFIASLASAKVSTKDQSKEQQIKVLRELGVEKIFSEKVSGKSRDRAEPPNGKPVSLPLWPQ
jgi:ABC-type Fe2+-enterobactin transport system substrate-binding protein